MNTVKVTLEDTARNVAWAASTGNDMGVVAALVAGGYSVQFESAGVCILDATGLYVGSGPTLRAAVKDWND